MKRTLLLGVCLLMSLCHVLAQSRTIKGKVSDESDNSPLPGVTVGIKGTRLGTITGMDGTFQLAVPADAKSLTFSFIGYELKEAPVPAGDQLSVKLVSDQKSLEEFVVTGYGVKRKRDVSGAVSSVQSKDIQNLPVQSFDRAMQGKMAGVQVIANNGIPGGALSVRVRGLGSINAGTEPLYIIDGVQVNSGDNTRNFPSANALSALNPDDIESIDVLKDPASASIYGAQAANGVVIVTTKKGKAGKTTLNLGAYGGFNDAIKTLDLLTTPQLVQLGYESQVNRYGKVTADDWLMKTFGTNKYDTLPTYDWQDVLMRRGQIQNYELSLSGGTEKTTFYLSGSMHKFEGQVIASDFTRGTMKLNLSHKVSNKVEISTGILAAVSKQNGVSSAGGFSNPNRGAILLWPGTGAYTEDGSFNEPLFGAYFINPLKQFSLDDYNARNLKMIGNLNLIYAISPTLSYRGTINIEYGDVKEHRYQDPRTVDGAPSGSVSDFNTELLNWQTNHTLNFNKTFNGVHKVSALIGGEYRYNVTRGLNAGGSGVPSFEFATLGATAVPNNPGSVFSDWKLLSGFGQASYTYDDRYTVTGTLRRDGSSRFGKNNRYGMFPSGSLMWRASQESFLRDVRAISDLKLRVSYGVTGNSLIGNYPSRQLFGLGGTYEGLPGAAPSALAVPDLTWESNHSANFGLDIALWKNRITFTTEYFIADRKNLLLTKPLPITSGFASIQQNVGSLRNKGYEFELKTVNLDLNDFRWETRFNFTHVKNEVTKLLPGQNAIGTATVLGRPINSILTQQWAGINPGDGRPMWYDSLGNITYQPVARDRKYLDGTLDPTWFGGLTNEFTYKGLTLRIFLQYSGGNYLLNQDELFSSRAGSTVDRNQFASQWRRWRKPGDITDVFKPYFGGTIPGTTSAYSTSDRYFEKGDYLRIKDITLSYSLPKRVLSRIRSSNARIFVTAQNFHTWSTYDGFDPELLNGTTGDFGVYPQSKQYTAGFQVTF